MSYDYLIVGAGLFGSVFARLAMDSGAKVLVIDKRPHIGGNCYTECRQGINVHKYGAHIFHTSNKTVWDFINRFCEFNNYINSPVAKYGGEIYNLPFNMNTFSKMWGITTPAEAKEIIESQKASLDIKDPKNLEEQALSLVGRDVYEKLIKGYTEKQWGRDCKELPAFIIKRLPLRFTYDNNYFTDRYQGIPIGGYTPIFTKLLDGAEVRLSTYYSDIKDSVDYKTLVYTGPVDEYFDFKLGYLSYRSLRFEEKIEATENYQGNAVVNYTEREVPYTRIIEHKHFEFADTKDTVLSFEYPVEWSPGMEPYYPVNDEENTALYMKYQKLCQAESNVIFGGRLGNYSYYDMDKVIALSMEEFNERHNTGRR